ncbi:MAG: hypothetical protein H0W88_08000 [Parachlamydiaceae bacterium]|nr:hypothetical protein [Parachlamydiaceae bacterium]
MKFKFFRFILYIFLIGIGIFALARAYYHFTDDFRLGNITSNMVIDLAWENPPLTDKDKVYLSKILNQKFRYIGKGAQCYAFASEDKLYVIKFFKFKHLKPSWFLDLLPSIPALNKYKQRVAERKRRKFENLFIGYELAYREDKNESALLYLHLKPSDNLHLNVDVIDKIGIERSIDLDKVVFLIQRKGETLRTRMKKELGQGHLDKAQESLSQIIEMYTREYKKGIFDRDHGVMHNTGFVDNRPFHLDVGKLTKDDNMKNIATSKNDLALVVWKIALWIKSYYPEYYQQISTFLGDQYKLHTGSDINMDNIDPEIFKKRRHGW